MKKKALLISMRNADDPILAHELHCFKKFARRELDWHQWNVVADNDLPADLDQKYDLITFGGSGDFGVTKPTVWLDSLAARVRDYVVKGQPMFCSCMGFQIMAYAHGGKVYKDPNGGEVGTYEMELTEEGKKDPVFKILPSPFLAQQGHLDSVDSFGSLPVIKLAQNVATKFQAIKVIDKPIYATQFHAELDYEENLVRVNRYRARYAKAGNEEGFKKVLAQFTHDDVSEHDLFKVYLDWLWGQPKPGCP